VLDESHRELLARVASLYYDKEKSQNEIAQELNLSRVKVYRILKQAREESVVKVVINWPIEHDGQLEKDLPNVFDLKKALVLKSLPGEDAQGLARLGQMTARYLESVLQDHMTLTVCMGRSTYEVINAVGPTSRAHINVAQAMGSLPFAVQDLDSAAMARQLAQKLGGQVFYLPSPLIAASAEAAAVLRSQPLIEHALTASRNADIALVGIGALTPKASRYVQARVISAKAMAQLKQEGAVGDIGGQFLTQSGEPHSTEYNRRMIGLTLEEMRRIPNLIAVAIGHDKGRAILGALHTGVIDVLCTDQRTARQVLTLEKQLFGPRPRVGE
jgi:deoxyribonucleoside regulator